MVPPPPPPGRLQTSFAVRVQVLTSATYGLQSTSVAEVAETYDCSNPVLLARAIHSFFKKTELQL